MLQTSLDLALKLGLVKTNVAREIGNLKKERTKVDFWTKEEFEKVVSTFNSLNYYDYHCFLIIYFMFMTGVRIGELQALGWDDFNFIDQSVKIDKSMHYRDRNTYYTHEPKTIASIRTISIDDNTITYLKQWKKMQFKNIGVSEYVFSKDGIPTNKSTLYNVIERHSKLANVHRIKLHALRHSHASLLISLGESALVVKERLGHEDIKTTLGIYGHLYPNANHEVANKLTGVINVEESKEKRKYTSNQFVKH